MRVSREKRKEKEKKRKEKKNGRIALDDEWSGR
jgi:hypothetical protein